MTNSLEQFARLNGFRLAPKPFSLYRLAPNAPPSRTPTHPGWPCADDATCFVGADGQPAAIVVQPLPDHDFRRLGDLVKWLKIPYCTPPGRRHEGERHFVVLLREGLPEPKWLPDLRAAA